MADSLLQNKVDLILSENEEESTQLTLGCFKDNGYDINKCRNPQRKRSCFLYNKCKGTLESVFKSLYGENYEI